MHLLITAGGTRQHIDPVRFISNASSGKMGYALARAALKAGHQVTLITAPVALRPPKEAALVPVESAADMFAAVKKHFDKADCLIMAAAVADYTPAKTATHKIKKGDNTLTLKLKRTRDILKWAGKQKEAGQIIVGFALEDKDLHNQAEKKLRDKKLDMIVANEPATIAAEQTTVHVKSADTQWTTLSGPKARVATRIMTLIEHLASQ
jgi:phosphopantothenoylcysteine decarboxylase/phosphopantothenate--cysteine ligase